MKQKLFFFLSCLLFCGINSFGQQQESMYGDAAKADVKMKYVYSYEEALQRAKKEKKLIFFNCFADWALPCHGMNKAVFSDQKFADYMNNTFVNLFIDVTTGEGRPFADKFNVRTFAQYLILDADGNIMQRIVGGSGPSEFKKTIEIGSDPKTSLMGTEAAYNAGDRSKKLLGNYSYALYVAEAKDKFAQISKEYLGLLKQKEYLQKNNWIVVRSMIKDRNSEMYTFLVAHQSELKKNIGDKEINEFIQGLFTSDIYKYASGEIPYDGSKMRDLYSEMQNVNIPDTCNAGILYRVGKLRGEKKYTELLDLMETEGPKLKLILPYVALSLKFDEPSEAQQKRLISYLRKFSEGESGSMKQQFVQKADALEFKAGIEFEEGLTFQQVLDKAKQENKLVFVDCYTSWCGPCKMMANNVFTQIEVGKYFNERFISVKIDMEKGEGVELAKRYRVKAYPTMMILEPSGQIAWRILGARQSQNLVKSVSTVANDLTKGYSVSKEAYEKGDRRVEVLANYIAAMKEAGEMSEEQAGKMIDDYLLGLTDEQFCSAATWSMLDMVITDVHSKEFERMLRLHDALCKQNTESVTNKKIEKVIFPFALKYFNMEISQKEVVDVLSKIKEGRYPKDYTLNVLSELVPMFKASGVAEILSFYEKRIAVIKDTKDRLNLDVLLPYFLKGADDTALMNAEKYVSEALKEGTPSAKKEYNNLLTLIKKIKEGSKNG